jgi:hypothetical protein
MRNAPYSITFTIYPDVTKEDERMKARVEEFVECAVDYLFWCDRIWLTLGLEKPDRERIRHAFKSPIKLWQPKNDDGSVNESAPWNVDQKITFPEKIMDGKTEPDGWEVRNKTQRKFRVPGPANIIAGDRLAGTWGIYNIYVRRLGPTFVCGASPRACVLTQLPEEEAGYEFVP